MLRLEDKACRGGQKEKCQGERQWVYLLFRRVAGSPSARWTKTKSVKDKEREVACVRGLDESLWSCKCECSCAIFLCWGFCTPYLLTRRRLMNAGRRQHETWVREAQANTYTETATDARWQSSRCVIHSGVNVADASVLLESPGTAVKSSLTLRPGCNTRSKEKNSLFLFSLLFAKTPIREHNRPQRKCCWLHTNTHRASS